MVVTRSQQRSVIEAAAADMRAFSSLKDLIAFVEVALIKPEYGAAVTHLRLTLSIAAMERHIVENSISAVLSLMPNISILELFLTPPLPLTSLLNARLPFVTVLKTNMPHRVLVPFVAAHYGLRALSIDSCGRSVKCALASIDVDHVTDIRCPVECAPHLVHEAITRLRLDSGRPGTVSSAVITKIPVAPPAIYVLTAEFKPEDGAILRKVAAKFRYLRNLKLIEKCKAPGQKHKARPWSDRTQWISALKQLPHLERLVIRTAGALTSAPNSRNAERKMFQQWVDVNDPHPTLRHITVWQRVYDRGGILSEWKLEDGVWTGTWTSEPDPYHVMTFDDD
ncbi:hypothetical protein C8Q76DRAFT_792818 [Earliella scabrosa]|nr:hypothetical protein C8Q76DRAFT_792818 [Earliella scabrosa]